MEDEQSHQRGHPLLVDRPLIHRLRQRARCRGEGFACRHDVQVRDRRARNISSTIAMSAETPSSFLRPESLAAVGAVQRVSSSERVDELRGWHRVDYGRGSWVVEVRPSCSRVEREEHGGSEGRRGTRTIDPRGRPEAVPAARVSFTMKRTSRNS